MPDVFVSSNWFHSFLNILLVLKVNLRNGAIQLTSEGESVLDFLENHFR